MKALIGWIVAYFFRWLPHSSPTGLFPVGRPDENSPVIVTANFSLTVKRVKKALEGQNLWLLVANTDGINVWCAAGGGIFTEKRVIDAIKIAELAEKVAHLEILLPALAAPGVDVQEIDAETGFRARFGPVYARDIPAYLAAGEKKSEGMRRFEFDLTHRLDMLVSMNFPIYLLGVAVVLIFARQTLLGYSIIFWGAVGFMYAFLNVIPGKTGWGQAFFSAAAATAIWSTVDWFTKGDAFLHWGWFFAVFVIFFLAGFDLAGIVSARKSDAELLMHRLGFKSFGSLFSIKELGGIGMDREKCTGCKTCAEICPVGVFGEPDEARKMAFRDDKACFACGACVKQCPEKALFLS
ncbi:MAG: 4Fe-4S binding protein [Candidatus Lernaella stagnicola]|nr:4Fe-4S binding protein [Candidatus Lernaella stagnicola]